MRHLKIDELKSLELGDWIWLVDTQNRNGAYVIKQHIPFGEDEKEFCFDSIAGYGKRSYQDYGKTWFAYKNKEYRKPYVGFMAYLKETLYIKGQQDTVQEIYDFLKENRFDSAAEEWAWKGIEYGVDVKENEEDGE